MVNDRLIEWEDEVKEMLCTDCRAAEARQVLADLRAITGG